MSSLNIDELNIMNTNKNNHSLIIGNCVDVVNEEMVVKNSPVMVPNLLSKPGVLFVGREKSSYKIAERNSVIFKLLSNLNDSVFCFLGKDLKRYDCISEFGNVMSPAKFNSNLNNLLNVDYDSYILSSILEEVQLRRSLFSQNNCDNYVEYKSKKDSINLSKIYIVIDDLLLFLGKDKEGSLKFSQWVNLIRQSRDYGIFIIASLDGFQDQIESKISLSSLDGFNNVILFNSESLCPLYPMTNVSDLPSEHVFKCRLSTIQGPSYLGKSLDLDLSILNFFINKKEFDAKMLFWKDFFI